MNELRKQNSHSFFNSNSDYFSASHNQQKKKMTENAIMVCKWHWSQIFTISKRLQTCYSICKQQIFLLSSTAEYCQIINIQKHPETAHRITKLLCT